MEKKKKLTPKQNKYCLARVAGLSQRKAYKKAYDCNSDMSADHNAYMLEKEKHIQDRMMALQRKAENGAILSNEQIKTALSEIALDETKPDSIVLKAYDQLARMQSGYSDSIQVTSNVNLSIEEKRQLFRDMLDGTGGNS